MYTYVTPSTIPYPETSASIVFLLSSPLSHHGLCPTLPQIMRISQTFHTPSVYRSIFSEILHSFPDAIPCFTDGSRMSERSGFVFSIGNQTFAYRHRNSATISTVELQAILQCIVKIPSTSPSFHLNPFLSSLTPYPLSAISNVHSFHLLVRVHTLLASPSSILLSVTHP